MLGGCYPPRAPDPHPSLSPTKTGVTRQGLPGFWAVGGAILVPLRNAGASCSGCVPGASGPGFPARGGGASWGNLVNPPAPCSPPKDVLSPPHCQPGGDTPVTPRLCSTPASPWEQGIPPILYPPHPPPPIPSPLLLPVGCLWVLGTAWSPRCTRRLGELGGGDGFGAVCVEMGMHVSCRFSRPGSLPAPPPLLTPQPPPTPRHPRQAAGSPQG